MMPCPELNKYVRKMRLRRLQEERRKWKKPEELKIGQALFPVQLPPRRLASKTGRR